MDEFVKYVLQNLPNLAGLVILAFVLYKQNQRLTDALLLEIADLRDRVEDLENRLK